MQEKKFWAAWSACTAGSRDLFKLRLLYPNLEQAWLASETELRSGLYRMGVSQERIQEIISNKAHVDPAKEWQLLMAKGIEMLIWPEQEFPWLLKQIADHPAILYIIGDKKVLSRLMVAVVGTRKCTFYGEKVTKKIVTGLAQAGLAIVSGLAHGIDTAAHETALANGAVTVGVTGYGFNHIPYSKTHLIKKICQTGAVVSEYYPGTKAQDFMFVQRNRIISGLAKGTLVTEAPKGSGALITSNFSLDQNRETWAVPGPIDQPTCEGTNNSIKEGAFPVTEANDILKILNLPVLEAGQAAAKNLNESEAKIFDNLRVQPLGLDQIVSGSGLGAHQVLNAISLLEIKGLISKNIDGKYHLMTI